jgi:hypothetical protein
MKTQQKLSPIEQALKTARDHFQGVPQAPYYNDKGFIAHPPPVQQGEEINNPRHNPDDLVIEADWFMDSERY